MSKCECCKEENSDLITYKGYKMCPTCYMGYVRKVKVCENNAKYETEITQLKQQFAEKQKTIDEINKEFVQAIHDWKTLCAEKDKEIERLKNLFELNNEVVINQGKEIFDLRVQVLQQKQNQKLLAIQELAEVERLLYESHYKRIGNKYYVEYEDINSLIDSRIKALEELKGEKNGTRN